MRVAISSHPYPYPICPETDRMGIGQVTLPKQQSRPAVSPSQVIRPRAQNPLPQSSNSKEKNRSFAISVQVLPNEIVGLHATLAVK